MADATIVTRVSENYLHEPGMEVVTLTLTDGETYQSRKFKTIEAALACQNEDNDADINVVFSGQQATINLNGQTDKKTTLLLFGRR